MDQPSQAGRELEKPVLPLARIKLSHLSRPPQDVGNAWPHSCLNKTFRLKGIHRDMDYETVEDLVRKVLGQHLTVVIRSLALDDPERKVYHTATLQLSEEPRILQELGQGELVLKEPYELVGPVLDIHFRGLTPLHSGFDKDTTIDVVAISGLGGHAFGSFKKRGDSYMWLRDSLPNDLPKARVFIYGYDSKLEHSRDSQTIEDIAIPFREAIKRARADAPGRAHRRPLILLGHSMGGIIIKRAIIQMADGDEFDKLTLRSICGVIFYGVPNQGMPIDHLVAMVGNQPNRYLLETLRSSSFELRNLSRDFPRKFPFRDSVIFSYYETVYSKIPVQGPDGIWTRSGETRLLVDRFSATHSREWESGYNGDEFVFPISRDHSNLVKFSSPQDDYYRHVLDRLLKICNNASNIVEKRFKPSVEVDKDLLQSLSFKSQEDRLDSIVAAEGTCNWLVQNPQFIQWRRSNHGILWIKGIPGSGKSTLMKYALREIERAVETDHCVLASYFVYGQGDEMQRSKSGLLRALLQRLLPQCPSVSETLNNLYKARLSYRGEHRTGWDWGPGELQEYLGKAISEASHHQYIILLIDALDELGQETALETVGLFQDLLQSAHDKLKICFSCRHYPVLCIPSRSSIHLEHENADDIRKVMTLKFRNHPSTMRDLGQEIAKRAGGAFQWAILVSTHIITLARTGHSLDYLWSRIQHLPRELHQLYCTILQDPSEATIRLLQWVYFAKRPLTWKEMRHAMVVDPGFPGRSISEHEREAGWGRSLDDVENMISTLSRGLVQVGRISQANSNLQASGKLPSEDRFQVDADHSKEERILFIHQSVADFLFTDTPNALPASLSRLAVGDANAHICKVCIAYLRVYQIELEAWRLSTSDGKMPLLSYVTQYWPDHAQQADDGQVSQEYILDSFAYPRLMDSTEYPVSWDDSLSSPYRFSAVPSYSQHDRLILIWTKLRDTWQLDRQSIDGGTIIHVMARFGLIGAFISLLSRGDAFLEPVDYAGETPLHSAVRGSHCAIVHGLLDKGAKANSRSKLGVTPLCIAASKGDQTIIDILLDAGAEVDPYGHLFYQSGIEVDPLLAIESPKLGPKGPVRYAIGNWEWNASEALLDRLKTQREVGQELPTIPEDPIEDPGRRVINKARMLLGEWHPLTILAVWMVTEEYWWAGRERKATTLEDWLLRRFQEKLGDGCAATRKLLEQLSLRYFHRGRISKARDMQYQLLLATRRISEETSRECLDVTFRFVELNARARRDAFFR